MMRVWMHRLSLALPWALIGIVAVLLTLLVMLPAAWIVPQFARATGGRVMLVDPAGSLWHGSATLMLSSGGEPDTASVIPGVASASVAPSGPAPAILPGRVAWHTAWWPLFTGHLKLTMRQSQAMPQPVLLDASLGSATLSGGELGVPASLLTGLGAPFNTLDAQGDVRLSWQTWRLLGRNAYGVLVVSLNNMSSRVSRVSPLGSYRFQFTATGRDAQFTLATVKGPLQLEGQGAISDGRSVFHGDASASPEAAETLGGLLNLLGRRTDENRYELIYDRD